MRTRSVRAALATVGAAALIGAAPATASELVVVDLPSKAGNVDVAKVRFNGAQHPKQLRANVLLPDGFDPAKRYPVLFLLHGAGEAYTAWVEKTKAADVVKGLDAIVVMPEAATGFYLDHYTPGGPRWERYFLDEVIPAIEARFPIRPGRRWHAVAGFSMGGFGAAYLASQRPDYFGAVGPMSGFVSPRRPEMELLFDVATGQDFVALYGPFDGAYLEGHDPVALAPNVRHSRLFVITGNGVPDPTVPPPSNPQAVVTDALGEAELRFHSEDLHAAARGAGADSTLTVLEGTHTHAYWNRHLRRLLEWDPFRDVAEDPPTWTYRTVADRGRAWGVTYRFAERPAVVQTLERTEGTYAAGGAGTVELCGADGRGLRAALPFEGAELRRAVGARVLDRRATAGRVRVQLTAAGEPATVRVAGRIVRGKRTVRVASSRAVTLAAGDRSTVTLRLSRAARALVRRGGARIRVTARYGDCVGGRWTSAARRLAGEQPRAARRGQIGAFSP